MNKPQSLVLLSLSMIFGMAGIQNAIAANDSIDEVTARQILSVLVQDKQTELNQLLSVNTIEELTPAQQAHLLLIVKESAKVMKNRMESFP